MSDLIEREAAVKRLTLAMIAVDGEAQSSYARRDDEGYTQRRLGEAYGLKRAIDIVGSVIGPLDVASTRYAELERAVVKAAREYLAADDAARRRLHLTRKQRNATPRDEILAIYRRADDARIVFRAALDALDGGGRE